MDWQTVTPVVSPRLWQKGRSSMPKHPEASTDPPSLSDEQLVDLATGGDPTALRTLLVRQQTWIYNLMLYMLHARQDAEDATQEVQVKIATGLASFKRASRFRTWARKIAVNHGLDFRRSRAEQVVTGFDCYAEYLDKAPDADFLAQSGNSPETKLLVDEARIACVMGMLLCLDREQRVVFLLGEILESGDALGAELLSLTKDNFRQRLCRAREQLGTFMLGRCGLVNPSNPCRCARKTGAFIRDGIVDPNRLQFAKHQLEAVTIEAESRNRKLESLLGRTQAEIRQLYPLFEPPDVAARLAALLDGSELRTLLNLN
jgi:RNA polymerase sigma factor (sigma-70 family)